MLNMYTKFSKYNTELLLISLESWHFCTSIVLFDANGRSDFQFEARLFQYHLLKNDNLFLKYGKALVSTDRSMPTQQAANAALFFHQVRKIQKLDFNLLNLLLVNISERLTDLDFQDNDVSQQLLLWGTMKFLAIFLTGAKRAFLIVCCLLLKVHTGNTKTRPDLYSGRNKYLISFLLAFRTAALICMVDDLQSLKKIKPKNKRIQNKLFKGLWNLHFF